MSRAFALALSLALALPLAAQDTNGTYKLDASHSTVLFRLKHLGVANFYGMFRSLSGQIVWDADLAKCKIFVSVDAESVFSGNKKRDDHIKGPDFLDTKQFPTLTFESESVTKAEGKDNHYTVSGKLTAHGVTKAVSFVFELTGSGADPWGGFRVGGEATFDIKRSDFGMNHMLDKLGDDVRLTIALEGVRETAEKK